MARIVYSRHYNIGFYGLERLHPFDSRKYGRAWKQLRKKMGSSLREIHVVPKSPITRDELLLIHTSEYLARLRNAQYLAGALEVPQLNHLPGWVIDWHVLRSMRWATKGSVLASQEAIKHGFAVNLGGGYHHAKPSRGEGFCVYSDIGIAVAALRTEGLISSDSRIAYIDTDAHQGNGVCHTFMNDSRVFIFDIYNSQIYPCHDIEAQDRIDCNVSITDACTEDEYLRDLESRLPGFLDSVAKSPIGLAFYNAGTDVFSEDPLGGLNLSAESIIKRDLFVVRELRRRKIPTIMVLSGGYTKQSFQIIADSVYKLLQMETALAD